MLCVWCPQKPEEGNRSPGTRVTDDCDSRDADLKSVLKEFRQGRSDTLTLLRALPHAIWQRVGIHPERGEMTFEQLATRLGGHDKRHLDEIRALKGRWLPSCKPSPSGRG